jgi:hypothetical protein
MHIDKEAYHSIYNELVFFICDNTICYLISYFRGCVKYAVPLMILYEKQKL